MYGYYSKVCLTYAAIQALFNPLAVNAQTQKLFTKNQRVLVRYKNRNKKYTSSREAVKANEAETLIAITIGDTVIRAILMEPSSTRAGYPILSGSIVVIGNETDTAFTVVNLSGGISCCPGRFCWSGATRDLAPLCPNACGLLSLPFLSFLSSPHLRF